MKKIKRTIVSTLLWLTVALLIIEVCAFIFQDDKPKRQETIDQITEQTSTDQEWVLYFYEEISNNRPKVRGEIVDLIITHSKEGYEEYNETISISMGGTLRELAPLFQTDWNKVRIALRQQILRGEI